jgi:hypothetical protein
MVMVTVKLLFGVNHRLRGWQGKLTEIEDDPVPCPVCPRRVRKAKRLAAYLNALRPLRLHILQRFCIAATLSFGSISES